MTSVVGLRSRLVLPLVAVALVSGVLGVQAANGGGDFAPSRPADPCAVRVLGPIGKGVDGLGERVVVLGLDGAACRLGVTREALVLDLATPGPRTDEQIDALRAGLLQAIERMKAQGQLPPASDLVDDALDDADLPGIVKTLIRALPDSLIDSALKTDDVLRRAVDELDLRDLLASLDDPDELNRQLGAAVTKAVEKSLAARVRDLI